MAVSSKHTGWRRDPSNSRLDFYYEGTRIGHINATQFATVQATSLNTPTSAEAFESTVTGNAFIGATGNVAIGNPGTFATTQPQGAVVMGGSSLSGIAPVGAITTAGAIFASDTVVRKIVAAGTASNVET